MENLETYIAFDLEFNTVDGVSILSKYRPLRWTSMRKLISLTLCLFGCSFAVLY